jgi:hypothetical protein
MSNITTPKLDSFRDLLSQAESRHADLSTLGAATRQRDAIKARMSECLDEAEARELIGDLAQAEEIVTIKKIRQPRLQSELSDLLTEAEKACNAAGSEASTLLGQTSQEAASSFQELLRDIQCGVELSRRPQLNDHATCSLRPVAMAERQRTNLSAARRAVALTTEPPATRLEGLRSSLSYLDRAYAAQVEIAADATRLTAACVAFRKAYTKR